MGNGENRLMLFGRFTSPDATQIPGDGISFDGVDGPKSPEFLQAIRNKAFSENKFDDSKYMVALAALSLTGPALEWFEHQDDDVQADWTLFRRAFLQRFPASSSTQGEIHLKPLIFTGGTRADCMEFTQGVRQQALEEKRSEDDHWMARYASSFMGGEALTWHLKLDALTRNSWMKLERALLTSFPDLPPPDLPTAGRVQVEGWELLPADSFLGKERWLQEARARRVAYEQARPADRTSVYWLLVETNGTIPDSAIQISVEPNGFGLYCARTWYQGGLHPGKAVRRNDWHSLWSLCNSPYIAFAGREIQLRQPYEVLVGDKDAVRWVDHSSTRENASSTEMKGLHAVEGGVDNDGSLLLVGKAFRDDSGWQPGKVGKWGRGCEIGWYGGGYFMQNYKILVWA